MRSEEPVKNYKVQHNTYVQEYVHQGVLELFVLPEAEGHLDIQIDNQKDLVLDSPEFIVAITS